MSRLRQLWYAYRRWRGMRYYLIFTDRATFVAQSQNGEPPRIPGEVARFETAFPFRKPNA